MIVFIDINWASAIWSSNS